jgi:S-adenosylmethionine:tRNA ribosyltransferase-isomerase
VLVFNDSRVRKARLYAKEKESGAETSFLLAKASDNNKTWQCMTTHMKRKKPGKVYLFAGGITAEVVKNDGKFAYLEFDRSIDDAWLDKWGHVPLPPYLRRADEISDSERYQTVYAKEIGSAAAPTAGLHFTDDMLARLREAGHETLFITLHVGLGTFLPVHEENIKDHAMHEESWTISDEVAEKIEEAKKTGRPVIATGTTSLRTLESAWVKDETGGHLLRGNHSTSIFIYPPYKFKVIDGLFTNFHTPESTLLMLVSALADDGGMKGREFILEAYKEAVKQRYKFFSYGDAMLIL